MINNRSKALLSALLLSGCAAAPAAVSTYSCNPQAPEAAYAIAQAPESLGVIAVRVVDAGGAPVAGARVSVGMEFTGSGPHPKCSSHLAGTTGADGAFRLERLMPGPYVLQLDGAAAEDVVKATVRANETTELTLTRR